MFRTKIKKMVCLSTLVCPFIVSNFCYSSESKEKIEIIDIDNSNYGNESSCDLLYDILTLKKEVFKSDKKVCDDFREIISVLEDETRSCHVLGLYTNGVNDLKCGAIFEKVDNGNISLRYIFTKKGNQRQGFGTKMMDYIKNMVGKGKSITLESTYNSFEFYEKCGFKKIGTSGMTLTIFEWKNS